MPKNEELIAEIEKLDKEVSTENLTNVQLTTLLNELREDAAAKENEDAEAAALRKAADDSVAQKKKDAEKAKEKPPYEVAEGCAITTKRGVLDAGAAISAEDLAGGEKAFNAFLNPEKPEGAEEAPKPKIKKN